MQPESETPYRRRLNRARHAPLSLKQDLFTRYRDPAPSESCDFLDWFASVSPDFSFREDGDNSMNGIPEETEKPGERAAAYDLHSSLAELQSPLTNDSEMSPHGCSSVTISPTTVCEDSADGVSRATCEKKKPVVSTLLKGRRRPLGREKDFFVGDDAGNAKHSNADNSAERLYMFKKLVQGERWASASPRIAFHDKRKGHGVSNDARMRQANSRLRRGYTVESGIGNPALSQELHAHFGTWETKAESDRCSDASYQEIYGEVCQPVDTEEVDREGSVESQYFVNSRSISAGWSRALLFSRGNESRTHGFLSSRHKLSVPLGRQQNHTKSDASGKTSSALKTLNDQTEASSEDGMQARASLSTGRLKGQRQILRRRGNPVSVSDSLISGSMPVKRTEQSLITPDESKLNNFAASDAGSSEACICTTQEMHIQELEQRLVEVENRLLHLVASSHRNEKYLQSEVSRLKIIVGTLDQTQELRYKNMLEVFADNFRALGLVEATFEQLMDARQLEMAKSGRARLGRALWAVADFTVACIVHMVHVCSLGYSAGHRMLRISRQGTRAPLIST